MQMKVLRSVFAAILVTIISFATLHMANADSFLRSPVQPHANQDAMNATITDGLRLANQSSQVWQEKLHRSQSDDQQEQHLTGLNSHNKFDNHSPSAVFELPF
jgi:hypothetical protein